MSAGVFSTARYVSDAGYVYPCKTQETTLGLVVGSTTNASGTGTIVAGTPSARLNGSKRTIGVNARSISVKFNGAAPTGYKDGSTIRVPIFTKANWDAIAKGGAATYIATGATVVGKTPEYIV